tara:strand:- start:769 stop:1221 length:453 start_codon:yes stop_codon:yes gene_type:complete
MRNVQAQIRKKIFDQSFLVRDTENNAIGGTIVPFTNKILPNQSYPYIYIRSNQSKSSAVNRDAYGTDNIITFEVHTRFAKTSGGDKQANFISDNLMDQIITRGNAPWFSGTTGFKIYSVELDNINFFQEQRSDGYYVRSVIDINFKTMEN